MTFTSPIFLFLFLPVVLALYFLVGSKWRNWFLILSSAIFYVFQDLNGIFLLLFVISANYVLGIHIAKFRDSSLPLIFLWVGIAINIGVLAWFKYDRLIVHILNEMLAPANLSLTPIQWHASPLGISFFTLTAVSYLIDVYREETEPLRDFRGLALFLSLFPKISAGPIVRYADIADEISRRTVDLERFAYGIKRFVLGLGKKVLIADTLAITADQIFGIPTKELTTGVAWLGVATYTLQIYYDFSGYTDMAIGLGHMFGFKFVENFDYPYISRSLTEFWRRWHISLSTWLRDYLFLPLSHALMTKSVRRRISLGRYKTNYRGMLSIVIVFTLCGLWHGVGKKYVVWGVLHGIVLAVESAWLTRVMRKWWTPLQHVYFLVIIMVTWVFFRSSTLMDALGYLGAIAGLSGNTVPYYNLRMYFNASLWLALLFGVMFSLPISRNLATYFSKERYPQLVPAMEVVGLTIIIVLCYVTIASSTYEPFIYQQF